MPSVLSRRESPTEAVNAPPATEPAKALALPDAELFSRADAACRAVFGGRVYVRGLIEATNRCVRNCLYCGIRRGNARIGRYSLDDDTLLAAVRRGWEAGIRSFVIQGGEDPAFGPERLAGLAHAVKELTGGEAALTYSFGTMDKASYALMKRAGADRYLMRFETSDPALHERLRGSPLSERLAALEALAELGYEVGSGFMTGLPGASEDRLEEDVRLAASLRLDMAGIGPFIPHPDTPLGGEHGHGVLPALRAVAALRLALPLANLPATTAMGSVEPDGRERALACGANVLMPNIGPVGVKKQYELYPGKICLDEDGLSCVGCLSLRVKTVGKALDMDRGDSPSALARAAALGPSAPGGTETPGSGAPEQPAEGETA